MDFTARRLIRMQLAGILTTQLPPASFRPPLGFSTCLTLSAPPCSQQSVPGPLPPFSSPPLPTCGACPSDFSGLSSCNTPSSLGAQPLPSHFLTQRLFWGTCWRK